MTPEDRKTLEGILEERRQLWAWADSARAVLEVGRKYLPPDLRATAGQLCGIGSARLFVPWARAESSLGPSESSASSPKA